MITSPADKQLIVDVSRPNQVVPGTSEIRTKVWDHKGVVAASYQIDNATELPLTRIGNTQV